MDDYRQHYDPEESDERRQPLAGIRAADGAERLGAPDARGGATASASAVAGTTGETRG